MASGHSVIIPGMLCFYDSLEIHSIPKDLPLVVTHRGQCLL